MYLFYTMANFQGMVLMITGILLVVSIFFVVILLYNSKNELEWPPLIGDCPDYWIDLSGIPILRLEPIMDVDETK